MSEGQNSTATLTEPREPTREDVELLHEIVLRAQQEPLATHRDSLLTAYETIFKERNLDLNQDVVCFYVLLEILKPDVRGSTLYEKFEHVMRNKHIEVVFEDEASTEGTRSSVNGDEQSSRRDSTHTSHRSIRSRQSSKDITDMNIEATPAPPLRQYLDTYIDNPPPHIVHAMLEASIHDKRTLFKQFLGQCRQHLDQRGVNEIQAMDQHAHYMYRRKLVFKVITHWRNVRSQLASSSAEADEAYLQFRRSRVLHNLHDSARVNRVQAMDEVRLRAMCLYKMTVLGRENAIRRKLDDKLKRRALQLLTTSSQAATARSQGMQNALGQHHAKSNARLAQLAISSLFETFRQLETCRSYIKERTEIRIKRNSLYKWYGTTSQMLNLDEMAQNVRETFLMRKYFAKIKEAAQISKMRRLVLGERYFNKWRESIRKIKHAKYATAYRNFRIAFKMRLARGCLRMMQNKLQHLEQARHEFDNHKIDQSNKNTHKIIVAWYGKAAYISEAQKRAVQNANMLNLRQGLVGMRRKQQQLAYFFREAGEFRDTRIQVKAQECLKRVEARVFEMNRRKRDFDILRVRHEKKLVKSLLTKWRQRNAENLGEGPLILPPATPAQRRADQLNRLASTTPLFAPKVSFGARLLGEVRHVSEAEADEEEEEI